MKHPKIDIIEIPNCVKYIRYGVGWAGLWFWEVVTTYPGETGIGFAFSTNFGQDREAWVKYSEYMFTLSEIEQKQTARRLVKEMEQMLLTGPHTYGGIYKFDTKRLFTLIKRHR